MSPLGADQHVRPRLTPAEAVAASAMSLPAAAIVSAYLVYRSGYTVLPFVILLLAIVGAAVVFRWLWHASGARLRASRYNNLVASHDNGPVGRAFQASHRQELIAFAAIVGAIFVWLLWLAWPTVLWVGGGPDITHHLVLIDYIERHWQLSRDVVSDPYLGDMVYYTPGSHLLIALAGAWTRTDGLHALYPVVAFTVALKAGFVFLIALRLLPAGIPRFANGKPNRSASSEATVFSLPATPKPKMLLAPSTIP